jgi:3-phenylpropionate/trans-cinnamate dioxygenase ferredoxin reductase subunit
MVDQRVFAIVGAGLTGAKAAEGLREAGFAGRIVLIGDEPERPYERPPLSKGYLLGKDPREKAFVHDAAWYARHGVELLLGVRATDLDPATHTLSLDGLEPLRYDRLLLATGSRARRLDVPGTHLTGVRYLRSLADADALVAALPTAPRVVVVGAGWIGLETAAAARAYGCDVTVVELDAAPLRRVLGDEVAGVFADLHRVHGVSFRFGTGVREFLGSDGRLRTVVLSDATELPADLAIVGVGVTPATELAEAAGLALDNGVATDAGLRTSEPDIYAAGDVASVAHPLLGRRIRVEHWANALNGGAAAGRAMIGEPLAYDRIPYFFTDQYDLGMEYSGWADPGSYDEVVFRGRPSIVDGRVPAFVAFWTGGGRVLAAMTVNVWDVTDPIQELIRRGYAGMTVDRNDLADPRLPLGDLLS